MAQPVVQWSPHLWVAQSRFGQTNAGLWLNGGRACLIDPGVYPDEIAALARFVAGQGAVPRTIVLTHSHWDHILGPEHLPGAQVVAHASFSTCVLGNEGAAWVETA